MLLRGVNVGGHAKVPMADLRELVSRLGCTDVVTYVQSGNVACDSDLSADKLAARVTDAIRGRWGLDVTTMVRSHDELAAVVAANPFGDPAEGRLLHVAFLGGEPDRDRLDAIDQEEFAPERFSVGEREIYLSLPDGIGRSKLAAALTERRVRTPVTVRNWNTVTKMLDLTAG